jgi:hypothetical protein
MLDQTRRAEVEAMTRLAPRIRQTSHELTRAVLDAWRRVAIATP